MTLRKSPLLILLATLILGFAACGGGSSSGGNNPPPTPISVAFNPQPPTSVTPSSITQLIAVVSNDSANAGVQWSVTCGGSDCGSFNPGSTASGAPTNYTAPGTVPSPNTVTVTATSVTDNTKSVSATITVGSPVAVLADGTYVFHLQGETSFNQENSPWFVAGAFTVANGAITGGEEDYTLIGLPATVPLFVAGCRLSPPSDVDPNIQIVLDTGDTSVGVNGVQTLSASFVSGNRLLISEFDSFASASGTLDLQTSAPALSGGYAFNLGGIDVNNQPMGLGGVLNFSGGNLDLGNSVFDLNDDGSTALAQTFSAGTVTAPDTFGRVVIDVTPSGDIPEFIAAGYIIDGNRIALVEGLDSLVGTTGGMAFAQGANAGNFSLESVSGSSYAFTSVGADINGTATFAGVITFNADGTISGNAVFNDISVQSDGAAPIAGNFTVDPTGRVSLTSVTDENLFNFDLQFYLDGNGNGLELGVDDTENTFGPAFLQNLGGASLNGTYTFGANGFDVASENYWSAVGSTTVASGALSGVVDYNLFGGSQTTNVGIQGTAEGSSILTGTITGIDADNPANNNAFVYFVIDGTRTVGIEDDGLQLGLLYFENAPN